MRALYLVPDLFGPPGGIARYCRLVARAMCESARVQRLDVLALWDGEDASIDKRYLFGDKASYRPFAGRQSSFVAAIMQSVTRGNYDVLIAGHVGFGPLLFTPRLHKMRARRLMFIYGVDAWDRLAWHKRLALRASDLIISISRYTADRATAANDLNPASIKLLYNCLDPELQADRATDTRTRSAAGSRTIVTVSRLASSEDKGHVAVLQALPTVLETVPDARYVIVGDGDFRPRLESLAQSLGVADYTQFVGSVSDEEVGCYLDSSGVYAMPGRNEGFGFVFLEAMARGLPVVAGIHDAAPEVLGPDAGVVVDAGNIPAVADALVRVLSDPELRLKLINAGFERLDKLFQYPTFRSTLLSHVCGEPM